MHGTKSHRNKSPLHMVSACVFENNLVLGRVKIRIKSNEITAKLYVLDILNIAENTVTIDAMGNQK